MEARAKQKLLNPKLENRSYPFAETALPKGPDPVWQRAMGAHGGGSRAPIINFQGQTSPYFPPDANGVVGPNHYMQTINTTYAIYNKSGALVAGPTNMNLLFSGVTGSSCNDGDPIVLYDEQADRWFAAEFSLCGSNDYMLMAVSTTNDPTGTWYAYSFDVADVPDYEKFGVWQDGYYMGTNTYSGNDIYVFQRSQMLIGGTAQAVGFDNPWRPTTIDGFMCVPPVDNDGVFAPAGSPGIFITINDDAIAGGSDQLWIYELDVNWTTPASSTFSRTQQINVAPFDSNFGTDWDNISQLNTTKQLDAIPQVIMNVPQYRNFGAYQTIVCCHTVDVDDTDHAGIRWYELRKTGGSWMVRQQGTYAPDSHSRWMGSIMLNGDNEIALGYSVSSSAIYPGIRYCGQSGIGYEAGNGILDIAESVIQNGSGSQTATNRWGDYSNLSVDPVNDSVFWFTTQYLNSSGSRLTRIASFDIPPGPGIWSGVTSADWNVASNWLDGTVPLISNNITIPPAAPNWPVFNGNLALGTNCGNITMKGPSQLTISGNLAIGSEKVITVNDSAIINVGGNWTNAGSFICGTGTVEFNGSSAAALTGKTPTSFGISNYELNTFPTGMVNLIDATTSTASGDDGSADVALPFTFYYSGVACNTVHICTNGWLSLNGSGSSEYENAFLFAVDVPNMTIAPWFDDLRDDNTSSVKYKTDGSAPNRVFTVEWYRVRSYAGVQYVRISFQVKLYETTNAIEFHYGTVESGTHNAAESASVGLEDATGGPYHFIDATTGSMVSGTIGLTSLNDWPSSNYRFIPNLKEKFHHLIVNKPGSSVSVNTDVDVYGSITVSPGSVLNVPPDKTVNLNEQ